MIPRLGVGTVFVALTLALDGASSDWQTKRFEDWTIDDAQAVMTDSAWSKKVPMPASARPAMTIVEPGNNGAPPPSASLGNPANTTTGTNMTTAGNGGSAGPAEGGGRTLPLNSRPSAMAPSVGAPERAPLVTIFWASATPVRLAILKLRSGSHPPSQAQMASAHKANEFYVIAVSGMPVSESDPATLAKKATLAVKDRSPYVAAESTYRKIGTSDVYFFRFRRDAFPITASDGEVEFKVWMGSSEVKKKFSLGEMQFEGNLAL